MEAFYERNAPINKARFTVYGLGNRGRMASSFRGAAAYVAFYIE